MYPSPDCRVVVTVASMVCDLEGNSSMESSEL